MRVLTFALSLGLIVAGAAGAQQKAKSEMVWEATIIGVSGWGAASAARKARAALANVEGIESVIVDTTARAVFRVEGKKKLSLKKLDAALAKTGVRGLRARKLQRRKMPIPGATYKVKMDGFSWSGSALNVRRMFEKKIPGVIAAYPDGATKTVEVLTYKAKGLTEKRIKSVLKNRKDLKLVSLECTSEQGADDDDASNN